MIRYAIPTALGILLATCGGCYGPGNAPHDEATSETSVQRPSPDNTEVNQRDADGKTTTPLDQGQVDSDVTITAAIRKLILEEDELSVNARNAKVITEDGIVTLRGVVETPNERAIIEGIAAKVAGAANVDNQLEVTELP